jgi:hypothetical protein
MYQQEWIVKVILKNCNFPASGLTGENWAMALSGPRRIALHEDRLLKNIFF